MAEIAEIAGDAARRGPDCVVAAAHQKIAALDEQQRELTATRARLEQLVEVCEGGASADCTALRLTS